MIGQYIARGVCYVAIGGVLIAIVEPGGCISGSLLAPVPAVEVGTV